ARTRRYDEPSNDPGPLSPHQFYPDCTIATRGYDFREGHGSGLEEKPSNRSHSREKSDHECDHDVRGDDMQPMEV
ncbi:MAG TPA: hypothetical protein VGI13_04440, partial [Candidatus Acidoferrum sp.]